MILPAALLAFVVGGGIASAGQGFTSIPAFDAPKYLGNKKVVCGKVAAVKSAPDAKAPTLLGLGRPFPDPELTIVIAAKDRPRFPATFEALLLNGEVCVQGKIEQADVGVQLKVSDAGQFKLAVAGPPLAGFAVGIPRPDDQGVERPTLLQKTEAKYTLGAMMAKIRGDVELEVVVEANGTVRRMQVVHSLDPLFGLDEAAMRAASKWTFNPATRDGQAIPCVIHLVMSFSLH